MKKRVYNLETGKIELHFDKSEYLALPEALKKELKSAFLFGRSGAWISRCKEPNLYRPRTKAGAGEKSPRRSTWETRIHYGWRPNAGRRMIMLEKLREITGKIEEIQAELSRIEAKANDMDKARLDEAISVCMKGLKFEKIYSQHVAKSRYADDYEYLDGMRGIKLAEKNVKFSSGQYGKDYADRELFLMADGTFKVFYLVADISYWQDQNDVYERQVSKNQDIFQFDFDEALENLLKALEKRLINLGERTKAQQARIEKLRAMQAQ